MNTGNLPIQAFDADVFSQRDYKVTVDFAPELDITGGTVEIFQRSKQIPGVTPTVNITGQQMVVTYTSAQLKKLPSITQHYVRLTAGTFFGWTLTASTSFATGMLEEAVITVNIGEDGQIVVTNILGADIVAGLTEEAQTARDEAREYAEDTADDRVATGEDRAAVTQMKDEFFDALPLTVPTYADMMDLIVPDKPRTYYIEIDTDGSENRKYEWTGSVLLFLGLSIAVNQPTFN